MLWLAVPGHCQIVGKCPVHKICPFLGMGLGYSVQLERWRRMSTMTVTGSLMMMFMTIWAKMILICLNWQKRREQSLQMHLKMIVRVVMNWMMKTCHCFLLSRVLSGQVGDTAVTRDIPLMSSADVYRDIVNIVVQSYGGNIVYIYDRNGVWITLKWNNHTVNSCFPLLCKPSPFHHHFKDTDNVTNNFWRQFLCGCYLGHQTVSREHVPFLLACSVGLQMLVSSVCLKKGMCHLYLHLCVTLLVTVTLKVWPLPSDFIYLHSDI